MTLSEIKSALIKNRTQIVDININPGFIGVKFQRGHSNKALNLLTGLGLFCKKSTAPYWLTLNAKEIDINN